MMLSDYVTIAYTIKHQKKTKGVKDSRRRPQVQGLP